MCVQRGGEQARQQSKTDDGVKQVFEISANQSAERMIIYYHNSFGGHPIRYSISVLKKKFHFISLLLHWVQIFCSVPF